MRQSETSNYRRRWATLAVLSLSLVIIGLDNTILNVALPTLQRTFDASASQLQWMVDSYVVVFAGLLLTMGALGDRSGRAKALASGLIIFGGASFFASNAGSAGELIAARAVMGIGAALIMPATLSIIVDVFPRDERGRAIAIWAAVAGVGIGLGPLLGGILLESFWWGSVFLVNVPVVAAALALGWYLVPDSRDPEARPLDLPGAVTSMGAVSALVYAIIEASDRGWSDPLVLGAFGAAIALGAAFAYRELNTEHPMLDLSFFRSARFSAGIAAISISYFALFGTLFLLTQYLQFVQGYSALEAGLRTAPLAIGIGIGAGRSDALVRRFGTTRVVLMGSIGLGLVIGSMGLWTVGTTYWIVGSAIALMAFFMGNVMAPATDSVMGAVPEAKAGVGSAMNDVTRQVGGALGIAVIGSVLNGSYSSKMADAVATLPPTAAEAASDSVGAAIQVAAQLPEGAGEILVGAAGSAFVDAFGVALIAGVLAAAVAAFVAHRYLPAEHDSVGPADSVGADVGLELETT